MDSVDRKLVAMATSLEGLKNNFRLFIYRQFYTIPANFVKIGAVDVEIVGSDRIIFKNTTKTYSPPSASLKLGGLN